MTTAPNPTVTSTSYLLKPFLLRCHYTYDSAYIIYKGLKIVQTLIVFSKFNDFSIDNVQ